MPFHIIAKSYRFKKLTRAKPDLRRNPLVCKATWQGFLSNPEWNS
jgi:hypothetical protein